MGHSFYLNYIARKNPFENLPHYEKLVGNMDGLYSRRINIQHRLVYQVYENIKKSKYFLVSEFLRNMVEVFWFCFVEIIDKLLVNIHKLEIDCNIAVFVDKNRVNKFA